VTGFLRRHETGLRLFLVSFLILYLELSLIRFTAAEVFYLGYFSNFVLISVFLGMGTGFLLASRKIRLVRFTPYLLLFLVAFVVLTRIDVSYLKDNLGQLFFGQATEPLVIPLWISLPLIFFSSCGLFAGLAQEAAICFFRFTPLAAYSIDIGGSLFGIAAFTLHSFFGASPPEWFLTALVILAVISYRYSSWSVLVTGTLLLALVVANSPAHFTEWSPYQRIEVWPMTRGGKNIGYHLAANGIGHQTMEPVGSKEPVYEFPYLDIARLRGRRSFDDVLVLGAGAGTDVSYALARGAKRVDAVEIDPVIQRAGMKFHPDRPYRDRRVRVIVDDGRAYMQRCRKRYDLVIFALPDSLAVLSSHANIRLESFLFTLESFRQAKLLLKENGVLVLYNYYRKEWLLKKLSGMLQRVFGHPPLVRVYTSERRGMLAALAIGSGIEGRQKEPSGIAPATDDWPFVYMSGPHLPPMYLGIMLFFVACAVAVVFLTGNGSMVDLRTNGAFALMGAAFLLLETKSVIQFLLLFGSTWLVNSLVFFAVLVSVLVANLMVYLCNFKRPGLLFALLIGSLLVQYLLPLRLLLGIESPLLRYVTASAVVFSPILFANLVFGFLFRDTPVAASAFGWNIIGTMIGGALEYASIATGYRVLTLVVIGLYSACFFWTYWTPERRKT
jgi:hypothetical protein